MSRSSSAARQPDFPNFGPLTGLLDRGNGYELCKRAIDALGSVTLLVLLMPLLAAMVGCVRASGRGHIFFKQKRLGRGGRLFWCYKFRTMVSDAESQLLQREDLISRFHENYKIKDDPRVTLVGGYMRRTSLDELPQLWNVLRGDMSLIGPRPIVEPELSKYGVHATRLLTVKPGLSGIWQVNGRSDTSYEERVAMDMQYIESRSLGLDMRLLASTAWVVIRRQGAY